jgi:hypothetical protein
LFSRRGAQRQLERKPEAHTELRLATQLELDVLAVRVRRAAAQHVPLCHGLCA